MNIGQERTSNVIKIDLAVILFLILYFTTCRTDPNQEPLDVNHPPDAES